jgi:hypothetical protein
LSVRCLEIIGWLSPSDIEYLGLIECELKLEMHCVAAENMYQLLERMGQYVKTLIIGDIYSHSTDIVYIKSDICVERILASCPNLVNFEFNTSREVVLDVGYDLPPSAFKNYLS